MYLKYSRPPDGIMKKKDLKQGIEEYRDLVRKKCSIEITQAEAERQFSELLALVRVIYRPIPRFDGEGSTEYNGEGEHE